MFFQRPSSAAAFIFSFKSKSIVGVSLFILDLAHFLAELYSRMMIKLMIQIVMPMTKPSKAAGMNM